MGTGEAAWGGHDRYRPRATGAKHGGRREMATASRWVMDGEERGGRRVRKGEGAPERSRGRR